MFRRISLQRVVARFLVFAVLMAAVAPAFSHALVAVGAKQAWVQICSDTGARWIAVAAADDPATVPPAESPATQHLVAFEHCPFCVNHGGTLALPATHAIGIAQAAGKVPTPALFLSAPKPLYAWAGVHSRAPPLSV